MCLDEGGVWVSHLRALGLVRQVPYTGHPRLYSVTKLLFSGNRRLRFSCKTNRFGPKRFTAGRRNTATKNSTFDRQPLPSSRSNIYLVHMITPPTREWSTNMRENNASNLRENNGRVFAKRATRQRRAAREGQPFSWKTRHASPLSTQSITGGTTRCKVQKQAVHASLIYYFGGP